MVLLYALGTVALANCFYYLLFAKFSLHKDHRTKDLTKPSLSLIVCAKNEAENLLKHIPLWLAQEYPDFELILINDASVDDTLEVMEQFAERDSRIQIVNVKNNEAFWANKKYALTLGIKRAKNTQLIFTDADCSPASPEWLSLMSAHFSNKKHIVLGYGGYEKQPGLLNKMIRFETVMTAIQYFSYAKAGFPYMGVGRNLAYTSEVYYENNGFMGHIKVASGDDDLFVNEAATARNTAICTAPRAFTYSIPKKKRRNWIIQKKRHYSTAKLYKTKHKFLLGIHYTSILLFWILSIAVLFTEYWEIGVIVILFRILLQYVIIGKGARKLRENDIVALIPLYELFLIFIQMSIFISKRRENNPRWK